MSNGEALAGRIREAVAEVALVVARAEKRGK